MSFRWRLVVVVSFFTLATLGAAFTVVSVAVNASQERQLDDALLVAAHEEARESAEAGGDKLVISDRPGPAANDVGPLTKYGAIYNERGRAIVATPTFRGAPPATATAEHDEGRCFDMWFGGEHLRAVFVPVSGRAGHRLLLAAPRTDLDGDAAFLRRAMVAVFLVAVAWAALVASWLVGRLTRAHERIATVARRVASGDLEARVGAGGGDPETARLGRDLDDMIQRLAALVTSQQQFIAHAAHELRSPLTTLSGELQHALRRERDNATYRAAIAEAFASTQRLKSLADDLLVLARVGSASDEPLVRARPEEVVADAVTLLGSEATARQVAIVVIGAAAPIACRRADVTRLIRNLVENAVRHSPAGTEVRIEIATDGNELVIRVIDRGPGILATERERIFEPFYRGRGEQAHHPEGAGLGLAIAQGIARDHGGDVVLESSSQGATFTARFPVRPSDAEYDENVMSS